MATLLTVWFFALACLLATVEDLILIHFWLPNTLHGYNPLKLLILTMLMIVIAVVGVTVGFYMSVEKLIVE